LNREQTPLVEKLTTLRASAKGCEEKERMSLKIERRYCRFAAIRHPARHGTERACFQYQSIVGFCFEFMFGFQAPIAHECSSKISERYPTATAP